MNIDLMNGRSVSLTNGEVVLRDPDWFGPKAISAEHVAAILEHFVVVETDDGLAVIPKEQKVAA
jgi:hypothetical protein